MRLDPNRAKEKTIKQLDRQMSKLFKSDTHPKRANSLEKFGTFLLERAGYKVSYFGHARA